MPVGLDLSSGAGTGVRWVAEMATWAGVHGGDEDEVGRISEVVTGAGNRDGSVFERSTEGFDDGTGKLGKLIQEENAVMGEGDFARSGRGASADDGGRARGMMRCAKGALCELEIRFSTREGMDLGDGNLLF